MACLYKHTQKGYFWPILGIFTLVMPLTVLEEGAGYGGGLLAAAVVAFCVLLFVTVFMSSLTVAINEDFVRVRFGGGLFRKKIKLSEIETAWPVRNFFLVGWGIRWYLKGWLYNVWGRGAVQLNFRNGKQVRIGTDEPETLARAINNILALRKTNGDQLRTHSEGRLGVVDDSCGVSAGCSDVLFYAEQGAF